MESPKPTIFKIRKFANHRWMACELSKNQNLPCHLSARLNNITPKLCKQRYCWTQYKHGRRERFDNEKEKGKKNSPTLVRFMKSQNLKGWMARVEEWLQFHKTKTRTTSALSINVICKHKILPITPADFVFAYE